MIIWRFIIQRRSSFAENDTQTKSSENFSTKLIQLFRIKIDSMRYEIIKFQYQLNIFRFSNSDNKNVRAGYSKLEHCIFT